MTSDDDLAVIIGAAHDLERGVPASLMAQAIGDPALRCTYKKAWGEFAAAAAQLAAASNDAARVIATAAVRPPTTTAED